jgi:hypothetical protein
MPITYDKIAATTLPSAQTSVTLSIIPSTFTDLVIVIDSYNAVADSFFARFQLNGDTSTNYSITAFDGNGTSPKSTRTTSSNFILMGFDRVPQSTTSTQRTIHRINIFNYANTNTFKTTLIRTDGADKGTNATVGLWRKTPEAITSITFLGDTGASQSYAAGSTFTLYGIKAA